MILRLMLAASLGMAALQPALAAAERDDPNGARGQDLPNIGSQDRNLPPVRQALTISPPELANPQAPPEGFLFHETPLGKVLTDSQGKTLYAMNGGLTSDRVAARTRIDGFRFCVDLCATRWHAVKAPAEAKPQGAWTVVTGAEGRQWAYYRNPVFTYAGDGKAGDINGNEIEDLWTAIAYIPLPPADFILPPAARLVFDDGGYAAADRDGRLLVTPRDAVDCGAACAALRPFAAGMANLQTGPWSVAPDQGRPQWLYQGRRVFVSSASTAAGLPGSMATIRPN